jgi:hypothetical protein
MTATTAAEAGGGEAGALGGDGIARINGQAVATAAAVEEEEEEGAADRDGDRAADGDGGPDAHNDRKDSDGSTAPRTGRMTKTTAATAVGGGAAAIPEVLLRDSRRHRSSSRRRMWSRLRLGDGDHDNDGDNNNGDGNDRQRGSSRRPTLSPSSSRSSVRDLVRSALGRMPFFPGIGAALPTTRAIIFIKLSFIALLPSHEI